MRGSRGYAETQLIERGRSEEEIMEEWCKVTE